MNIIFLTLVRVSDIDERGIYQDLMRKFRDEGNHVYIVTPCERRLGLRTSLIESKGVNILSVETLNIQKTNIIEKGIGTFLMEGQFKSAIKKYLGGVKFDLITYSTPPITFTNVVRYLKKENPNAITYLLLKDIFPQNAVDIGMMTKSGVKGLLYKFFRKKEKNLYLISDHIGCMSPANVEFVLKYNPEVSADRVEVAPNSIELNKEGGDDRQFMREKYGLPIDKPIFIYGGNLGKPQGIDFLLRCLDDGKDREDCFFVVVGSGTEYHKIAKWYENVKPTSVKVMRGLPKEEYDRLVKSCDVGLIFLDYRFTIPNFPSRLLSYLEYKMPVICATDVNTDIGSIAEDNGFGYWCESRNAIDFTLLVNKILSKPGRIKEMGEKGFHFLKENYLVENTYNAIMKHLIKNE